MPPSKASNGPHILDMLFAVLPVWVHDYIRGDQQCGYMNPRYPVFIHRRTTPFDPSGDMNEGRDKDGSDADDDAKGSNNSNGSNGSKGSTSNNSTTNSQTANPFTTGSDIFCQFCVADNDARVLYNGPWSLDGAGPSNTTHSTSTAGSTVSLSFNGSGIIVFGAVPSSSTSSNPPTTSFTVDAAAPFVTTEPQLDQTYLNQPLFVASELSEKEHKIVINVTDAGSASPFILDYFFISPHPNSTSNTEATISFAPTPSASVSTFPSAIKSTTSSANNVSSVTTASPAIIKILAALLGVMFLIITLLIALLVVYIRKSKVRHARSASARSFKSHTSQQGTLLTTTESIIRNFTPSLIWSYSRSEAGSGTVPSPVLPKSQQSEARSVWSAA